jgi:hypothetical protein
MFWHIPVVFHRFRHPSFQDLMAPRRSEERANKLAGDPSALVEDVFHDSESFTLMHINSLQTRIRPRI